MYVCMYVWILRDTRQTDRQTDRQGVRGRGRGRGRGSEMSGGRRDE